MRILWLINNVELIMKASIEAGLLFCGAIGLLCFFILLIYLKSKVKVYLYYFLFLFFTFLMAIFSLGNTTLLNVLFHWSDVDVAVELMTMLAFSAYCFFSLKLLRVKAQDERLYKLVYGLAILAGLYGVAYCFVRPELPELRMQFFIGSRFVILLLCAIAIFWKLIKIHSPVKHYYLIGSGWYFFGALLAILRDTTSALFFDEFYDYAAMVYFQSGIFLEVICFTLALSYLIFKYYEDRQQEYLKTNALAIYEKEKAQAEALAWRIQLNPHFLFNYLNVLKYYIQINQNKKAIAYLMRFSRFIRQITELDRKEAISLNKELDLTKQYIELEGIRYNNNITCKIHIDKNIAISEVKVPPMLLQPLVEELVWDQREGGDCPDREISIHIHRTRQVIFVVVEEENQSDEQLPLSSSLKAQNGVGKNITAERIELFNKKYKKKIKLDVVDRSELIRRNKRSQMIIQIGMGVK